MNWCPFASPAVEQKQQFHVPPSCLMRPQPHTSVQTLQLRILLSCSILFLTTSFLSTDVWFLAFTAHLFLPLLGQSYTTSLYYIISKPSCHITILGENEGKLVLHVRLLPRDVPAAKGTRFCSVCCSNPKILHKYSGKNQEGANGSVSRGIWGTQGHFSEAGQSPSPCCPQPCWRRGSVPCGTDISVPIWAHQPRKRLGTADKRLWRMELKLLTNKANLEQSRRERCWGICRGGRCEELLRGAEAEVGRSGEEPGWYLGGSAGRWTGLVLEKLNNEGSETTWGQNQEKVFLASLGCSRKVWLHEKLHINLQLLSPLCPSSSPLLLLFTEKNALYIDFLDTDTSSFCDYFCHSTQAWRQRWKKRLWLKAG